MVRYRKRGRGSRRRKITRRRLTRRKRVSRVSRSLNVHSFRRWAGQAAYNFASPNVELDVTHNFQIGNIVNPTEFSSLYDRYMITGVLVRIRLINNPDAAQFPNLTTGGNPGNIYPRLWYCPDYDDNATETVSELKERSRTKMRVMHPDRDIKIFVRPAVNAQLYRTAVTTGYSPKWKQWVDFAQTDVPHYGLKWAAEIAGFSPVASYPYSFTVNFCYYFKCKDTR